jgi:hypothetical protein
MSRGKKMLVGTVVAATALLTPTSTTGCMRDGLFSEPPPCRAEGSFCLAGSECCSGHCDPTNMMDPSGECS